MAFGSLEMASAIAAFYGVGAGVFLLPETELTAELVGSLTEQRVVVLDSARDYNGATGNEPGFPWPDRVIAYDFVGALRRQSAT
jgi:hypothetical protein